MPEERPQDYSTAHVPASSDGQPAPTGSICIITPSHIGDIEQFAILRRSIRLFAPSLRHVALVNTEDCRSFRERFRGELNLEIVKSADVLPLRIEYLRRKSGPKWWTGGLRGKYIKGWHAQQLMKIFALAECAQDAAAFVDSDVFFCRPMDWRYFFVDGRLKLLRRQAVNAEQLDFDIATHEILGNPLHQITQLYDYIYSPTFFRKSTAVSLLNEFERRKRGRSWVRRFVEHKRPSEYNLLGYAARVLENEAGYHLIACDPDDLHHSIRFPEDRSRLDEEIELMRAHPKDFVLIQSTLHVGLDKIAGAFETVAAAHGAAPQSPL